MAKFLILLVLFLIACNGKYQHTKYIPSPVVVIVSDDANLEALYQLSEEGLKVCRRVDANNETDIRKCLQGYLNRLEKLKRSFIPPVEKPEFDTIPTSKDEY